MAGENEIAALHLRHGGRGRPRAMPGEERTLTVAAVRESARRRARGSRHVWDLEGARCAVARRALNASAGVETSRGIETLRESSTRGRCVTCARRNACVRISTIEHSRVLGRVLVLMLDRKYVLWVGRRAGSKMKEWTDTLASSLT